MLSFAPIFNKSKVDILLNLANYKTREEKFSSDILWESTFSPKFNPRTWWAGLLEGEPLSKIASTLLSIPPSSASIERIWSQFSAVHSKSRNRLKNARVNKQIFIKSNYNLFDRDSESISH